MTFPTKKKVCLLRVAGYHARYLPPLVVVTLIDLRLCRKRQPKPGYNKEDYEDIGKGIYKVKEGIPNLMYSSTFSCPVTDSDDVTYVGKMRWELAEDDNPMEILYVVNNSYSVNESFIDECIRRRFDVFDYHGPNVMNIGSVLSCLGCKV